MTEKQLAKKHKCDVRTIRRWKKAGAPLDDAAAMQKWLAGRQHLPPRTEAAQFDRASKRITRVLRSKPSTQTQGAAHALKRLETAEVSAYAAMEEAMESGTAIEVRL